VRKNAGGRTARAATRFFDAHCDAVLKVQDGRSDFVTGAGEGHVTLPGLRAAGVRVQVFAAFVLSERHPGRERAAAEACLAAIRGLVDASGGAMRLVLSGSEVRAACEGGPIGALLALEGADPLEGRPEAFEAFHRIGVRDLILAWKDNPFSGTAFGTDTPLTPAGCALVQLAQDLGTMIDVSHLSDNAFEDVARIARGPFIASHSDCRALVPSLRNLTDRMIRKLADRGGVMGINLHAGFLDPARQEAEARFGRDLEARGKTGREAEAERRRFAASFPRPPLDWVGRHVQHAMEVGGEDCVGLGGDLDGTDYLPDAFEGVGDYPKLVDGLLEAGLTSSQVEKVAWRNFERVFCDVLPG